MTLKILLSNDDGVDAPGLFALAQHLSALADITVVAPDRDRSASSNALTLTQPLRVKKHNHGFYAVDGTPSDCVRLAITGWLESHPDMIISGINRGANLGDDLLYSGTVAAAMEGRFLGYPAMAISLVNPSYGYSHENFTHFDTAAKVAQILLKHLLMDPLPPESILNVNVPDLPFAELKGFQVTRMGHRHMAEKMIQSQDGKGHPVYWVGPPSKEQDAGPGTDFYAVNQGYVSITPIKVDLTDYSAMSRLAKWTEDIKDHHGTIFTPV